MNLERRNELKPQQCLREWRKVFFLVKIPMPENMVTMMRPSLWYSPHFLPFQSNRRQIIFTRNLPNHISKVCRRRSSNSVLGLAVSFGHTHLALLEQPPQRQAKGNLAHQGGAKGSGYFLMWPSWLGFLLWQQTESLSPAGCPKLPMVKGCLGS